MSRKTELSTSSQHSKSVTMRMKHTIANNIMYKMVSELSPQALTTIVEAYLQDSRVVTAEGYYRIWNSNDEYAIQAVINIEEFVHAAQVRLNLPLTDFDKHRKFDAAMTGFTLPVSQSANYAKLEAYLMAQLREDCSKITTPKKK